MINKERKHFGLVGLSRAPRKRHSVISNTCLVQDGETSGYCYIKFSESFVTFVGKKLHRGVAVFDPAFVEVVKVGESWEVWACYHRDAHRTMLWVTDRQPSWIETVKKVRANGNVQSHPTEKIGSGRAGSSREENHSSET